MKKKVISIMLVGALIVSMGAMAGCGSSSESAEEKTEEKAEEKEEKEEEKIDEDAEKAETDEEEGKEKAAEKEEEKEEKEEEKLEETEEKAEEKEGKEEEKEEEKEEGEETVISETAPISDDTDHSLTVFAWDPSFNIPALEAAEKDYKENVDPDFSLVILEQSGGSDVETLITNVASTGEKAYDQLADITLFQDSYFEQYYENYPDIWLDLGDADIDWDDFSQEKLSFSTIDGVHYGVPVDSGTAVAAYRVDILEDCGYTIDDLTGASWDEVIEIGKDVYEQTGKYLLCEDAEGDDLVDIMMQAEGASQFKDGEPYIADNPTMIDVVAKVVEMAQENVLLMCNSWEEYADGAIQGDRIAGIIQGNWILPTIELVPENEGKWEITSIPTLEGGEGYASNGGSQLYITAGCDNYDLAVDFLAYTFGGGSYEQTGESITYDDALINGGVITTFTPAAQSVLYSEGVPYFNNTPIYQEIAEMTAKVPTIEQSPYSPGTYVAAAIIDIINGADEISELEGAETQLRFEMGLE